MEELGVRVPVLWRRERHLVEDSSGFPLLVEGVVYIVSHNRHDDA